MSVPNMDELNDQPTVAIEQGKLVGIVSKDMDGNIFYSFKGIPYAKPPLGILRFKAPLPPEPWKGLFDATQNGSCCFSVDLFKKEFVGSEDCLNLNVYTPTLPAFSDKLLPVMVWIHGGGFLCGSNSPDFYGPEFLVASEVVIVAINYRLGLLGFLSIDDPLAGVPGNAGFKDMVMALQWVKKNIKHFNGNPDNVTIFGESAGGVAVHLLMLFSMTQGLFHKAIAQSGCALNPWSKGRKWDKEMYKVFECEGKSSNELLQHLQNLPVEVLLRKQGQLEYHLAPAREKFLGFVIERKAEEQRELPFICEDPIDIILFKKYRDVPFMIGFMKSEGLVVNTYKPARVSSMITDFENNVPFLLGYQIGSNKSKMLGQEIKMNYYGKEEPSENNRHKLYEMVADNLFLYGIYTTVKLHALNSVSPIFFYQMSLKTSLKFLQALATKDSELEGAHGDDVPYLFKNIFTPKLERGSLEYVYIKKVVNLWTNFAYYGNPSSNNSPVTWKSVTKNRCGILYMHNQFSFHPTFNNKNLQFWDKLYSESPSGYKFSQRFSKL